MYECITNNFTNQELQGASDFFNVLKLVTALLEYIDLFKVTGNALNIEYYFWWRDDCFGLLIHHNTQFHFMVSISDEYH